MATRDRGRTARRARAADSAGSSAWVVAGLWPTQRLPLDPRGAGLHRRLARPARRRGCYQQINLILLVAGLAAGPIVGSIFVSAAMLRRLRVTRRVPAYVFSGEPLALDYTLENDRRWTAALALFVEDDAGRRSTGRSRGRRAVTPRVFFARVPGRDAARVRWQGPSPKRGQVPVPDARPGHPLAVRAARAAGHDRRARTS